MFIPFLSKPYPPWNFQVREESGGGRGTETRIDPIAKGSKLSGRNALYLVSVGWNLRLDEMPQRRN